jgi:hypothetical protein
MAEMAATQVNAPSDIQEDTPMFMQDFTRLTPVEAFPAHPVTTGLAAGTPVETAQGWCPVETLQPGMRVQTLDGGLARIVAIDRTWLLPAMQAGVLHLPGGAFGNCSDLVLLPDQHLLIDLAPDDVVPRDLPDTLAVLIPALALEGQCRAVRKMQRKPLEVVTLVFAEEELVWAASGLLVHCPGVAAGASSLPQGDTFPRLPVAAARRLLACREAEAGAVPGWLS